MARPKLPESRQNRNRRVVYLSDDYDQLIRIIAARKGMAPGVLARTLLVSRLDQLSSLLGGKTATSIAPDTAE